MSQTVLNNRIRPGTPYRRFKKRHFGMALILIALIVALSYEVTSIYSPASVLSPKVNTPKNSVASQQLNQVQSKPTPSLSSKQPSHIFLIILENQPLSYIIGSTSAPYLNSLISTAALATNYSAVTHPSLPNYIALTSASTDGITTDCNPPSAGCIVSVPNIADEIEASGRSWKQYAESMPSPCYSLNYGSLYATKHVPFLYYSDIINNPARCQAHVVPYSNLATDLSSNATTPNFAFITPNLCNDMHSCPISSGDSWLATNVPLILNSPAFKTTNSLLMITWDEGNLSNNIVGAIFAGSDARAGARSSVSYNHYSLLKTIETLWGLKPLTANDQNATAMTDLVNVP